MDDLVNNFRNLSLDLNLIKSSRTKKDGSSSHILIDDEFYEYKMGYRSSSDRITWRCNNTQFPNCPGTVYTYGLVRPIIDGKDHEHSNSIKTKVKIIKTNIREMAASQPDTKPRKIIMECQKNLPEEVAANLPTYSASRQLCRLNRVDKYKSYEIPSDLSFELHPDFKTIKRNDDDEEMFLIFDNYDPESENENRILIFSTNKNLQLLNYYRHWLCDGTFDASPKIFKQLFSIHVIKNMKNLPLVYALLSDKRQDSYTKVFDVLKKKLSVCPLSVSCDYEVATCKQKESVLCDF